MKKIAVLTSGGDAPGMNAAIIAVIKAGMANGLEVYGIKDGYSGLYHGKIKKLEVHDGDVRHGGTFLGSARFPEFAEELIRKEAIKNLDKLGIEALVVIGGDGSFMGAKRLSEMGYPCIGIPGTIDNDTPSSDFTIGFNTALETIIESIDKLKDTSASHQRCAVVEVMGRDAGDLALWSAVSSNADYVLVPEVEYDIDHLIKHIKKRKESGKRNFIIVVAEGLKISEDLAKKIEAETGVETRATVLGHVQRGGSPTPFDRVLASRMGKYAVDLLLAGKTERCLGIVNNKIIDDDIMEALNQEHTIDESMYKLANEILNK